MENIKIVLQYEPSSLQDTIFVASTEETTAAQPPDSEPELEPERETVDFHLTESVVASLRGILFWSKVLVVCFSFFILLEVVLIAFALMQQFPRPNLSEFNTFGFIRSALSIGIMGWFTWQAIRFNRQVGEALKFNDNMALAWAFYHQNLFFKWVFYNTVVIVVFALFKGISG